MEGIKIIRNMQKEYTEKNRRTSTEVIDTEMNMLVDFEVDNKSFLS